MSQLANTLSFYNKDEQILGKPIKHWIIRWWQANHYAEWRRRWAPIFFLPGRHKSQTGTDMSFRTHHISSKKPIMLCPINYFIICLDYRPEKFKRVKAEAAHEIDIIDPKETITVQLDGEYITSGWFRADSETLFDDLGQKLFTDGYWMIFKPGSLAPGKHRLNSIGMCRAGTVKIAIDYQLIVE